jgi:hypothetical protein
MSLRRKEGGPLSIQEREHRRQACRSGGADFSAPQRDGRTRTWRRIIEGYQLQWHFACKCCKCYKQARVDLAREERGTSGRRGIDILVIQ